MGGWGDEKVVIVFWVEENFYFCPESLNFFKTKKKKKKKEEEEEEEERMKEI